MKRENGNEKTMIKKWFKKNDKKMIKKNEKTRKIAIFNFFLKIFAPLEAKILKNDKNMIKTW